MTLYAAASPAGATPTPLASVTTNTSGQFTVANVSCPTPASQVYAVASGGDSGFGNNAALHLLAVLGECQHLPASISVTALTTAAATYALAQFLGANGDGTTLANADQVGGAAIGLELAAARALSLTNATGDGPGVALPVLTACTGVNDQFNCDAERKLDTLANALDACAASSGASSNGCSALFCSATPGDSYNATNQTCPAPMTPVDTLQAALSIALHPALIDSTEVYSLGTTSTAAFIPTLSAAPADWTLALNFTGGGLSEPTAVAVDAGNRVWVANYNGVVSEFDGLGIAISASGYGGGGLEESFSIAIAPDGAVWICNEESTGGVNSGHGSLTVLSTEGAPLSGATGSSGGGLDFPVALAIDAAGNVWAANEANASISTFAADGTARSPGSGYTSGGLGFPSGLAIDALGRIWISNTSSNAVTVMDAHGSPLSGPAGYVGGGMDGPAGIALDPAGNAWVTNYYGGNVTALDGGGQPLPGTPYAAGALEGPAGIAVDSAGSVWVANYHGASLSHLTGANTAAPGAVQSPAGGYAGGGLSLPSAPAIDQAGNLWIGHSGNNSLTEFVGVAAPTRTPLAGLPARP